MTTVLDFYATYVVILGGILGLIVGSFLNVVVYRLPLWLFAEWKRECRSFLELEDQESPSGKFNIAVPASHCPQCKAPVKAWQNIPVISYLLLKGKCASCKTKISPRYPIVELLTGIISAFTAYKFGFSIECLLVLVFSWSLIALTLIDADHQILPDTITLPLLWLGLIANSFGLFTDLHSAVIGAAAGYLSLWSVYWIFKVVTGKEGMGFGDFKLLAALGAWMGWQQLPLIIILSAFVGAVLGIIILTAKKQSRSNPIPYGPYLAAAGWVAFYWGDQLRLLYFQFSGI